MWHMLASVAWLLFLVGWYTVYFYAIQPKQGTLEWINMYDRQKFSCLSARQPLCLPDLGWIGGCVLVTGAVWAWHLSQLQPLGAYPLRDLVMQGIMPTLGAAGIYLLARFLGCQRGLSILGACCMALSFDVSPAAGPAVLAMALFYGWMSQPADAGFVKNTLWLLASWFCTGMTVVLAPAAWWLLPMYGVLWLFVVALRWREGYSWGQILLNGFLCLLLTAGMLFVFLVFWSVQPAGLAWTAFPAAAWNGALKETLGQLWPKLADQMLEMPDRTWLDLLLNNSFVVLAGAFAAVALLLWAVRQHSIRAAVLLVFTIGLGLVYLVSSAYLLPVVFLVDTVYLADRMWSRGLRVPAVLLPALLLVMEISNQLLG